MPSVYNPPSNLVNINPDLASVRYWMYAGPWDFPRDPAVAMPALPVEVATFAECHFLVYEGFTRRNAAGTSLGRGMIDTGVDSVAVRYQASDVGALLANAFPATGPE